MAANIGAVVGIARGLYVDGDGGGGLLLLPTLD